MRITPLLGAALVLVLVLVIGVGACRKYVTEPVTRRPVITSMVAFPTLLGPGDSTLVTVTATDPDGDQLHYDWEAFNGLIIKGGNPNHPGESYYTSNTSMVFYRSTSWPGTYDTAFVWCTASDHKGGSDSRRILIFYND